MTGAENIEGFARLAGALSLLAAYKIGRGGGWTRARQRLARAITSPRNAPATTGRGVSSGPGRVANKRRYRDRLRIVGVVLWVALLLSLVGYFELRGEAGLADLEGIGLVVVTP